EARVLDGLRRMLRPLRDKWDMTFAAGGQDALASLQRQVSDVLVTDMRMPGMDGAQLLSEVRDHYPRMIRIVLTGQCDKEATLRCLTLAHRHLTKPCAADELRTTVMRACALQSLMVGAPLVEIVSGLKTVPSCQALYQEVVREVESAEPSLRR